MSEEEQQPLTYVHETVLKKRKNNDEWAIKKRERLQTQKQRLNEKLKFVIKRPEQFVKEYRDKELDLIRMKNRLKVRRTSCANLKSELLFVIRINGSQDMHPKTKKFLKILRLGQILTGVFLKANESTMRMLLSVEPFITYGYPNLKSVRDLIYKKGRGKLEKQRFPLTDNNLIEQALGKSGILCIEDVVHEIATVGSHFREAANFLCPLKLKAPERRLNMKKKLFKDGGDSGNREDQINELITKLN